MKNQLGLLLTILLLNLAPISGTSRQDLITSCNKKESTCLGFNKEDAPSGSAADCSNNVEKCTFAFATVNRLDDEHYRVRLAGKGSGWVGLAFSDDPSFVMKPDNLGVVCVNGLNLPVQILKIQDRSPGQQGAKIPFGFDNSALSESVAGGKLELNDGWMICEFRLSSKPRHGKKMLDLKGVPYKIGLAWNVDTGVNDGTAESANQPVYHSGRGSSARKLDTFQRMDKDTSKGGGSRPTAASFGASLVGFFAYIICSSTNI